MCELNAKYSNNQAEYQALIIGLKMLAYIKAKYIQVLGDSQLIIKQLIGEYNCYNPRLVECYESAVKLLHLFADAVVEYIPRSENGLANDLA